MWYGLRDPHLQLPEVSAVKKPVGPEFRKLLKPCSTGYYSPNMNEYASDVSALYSQSSYDLEPDQTWQSQTTTALQTLK